MAAKKLTPYFQGRIVRVLTDQPIGSVLRSSSSSGRLVKWALMLTQFALEYKPRSAIKGQALADFVVECTAREANPTTQPGPDDMWWELATDGSSGKRGAGGGVVITSPEGFKFYHALIFYFSPTNNEAEYEAFIAGLRYVRKLGAQYVRARTDSALVVGQVLGNFEANGDRLVQYRNQMLAILVEFEGHTVEHVPRADNVDADVLSKLAQEAPEHISRIARIEEMTRAAIDALEVAAVAPTEENWITDLMQYLTDDRLPDDTERARKVKLRAPRFQEMDGRLYRRSYGGPLMRCLNEFEADLVMTELHSGICSAHHDGKALARRIMLIGYYWPSIQLDCKRVARECEACQVFAKVLGRPATFYQPVSTAIPFARWGVDIVGPFTRVAGRKRFIILVTDNGKQFEGSYFADFLATIGTKAVKSSVAYPQGNGQVENANRTILEGLKKKLYSAGRSWADELPYILWAYRTTPREATKETPFALVYGAEARLPVEAWIPTAREREFDPDNNDEMMTVELDTVDERREQVAKRIIEYQKKAKAYHDARVRPRYFQVGDFVLRKREANRPLEGGKLSQSWEGPYKISAVIRPGTYKLQTTTGKTVDRVWNSENLTLFQH
ncbi:PREDICTED: uncharacterized protein LOC109171572 [Ipomoea nil]|uniref:uncharacterized protein LOC109171572 n=1 Tax=Ipomoea nil TaxID=35883 RepID=UPI000900A35B|nr:PREDICTED: uncharacterized protein LOC109171572 [Ipomoea nil]